MLHGSTILDYGAYTSYIGADAAGVANLRVVAPGFSLGPHVQEILVSPHSGITTPADLKGKTIAVNVLNGIAADLVYSSLAAYGITPAQVKMVAIPFPAMSAAIPTTGATSGWPPIEPAKLAWPKSKTPPSAASKRYPPPLGRASMPTIGWANLMEPVLP